MHSVSRIINRHRCMIIGNANIRRYHWIMKPSGGKRAEYLCVYTNVVRRKLKIYFKTQRDYDKKGLSTTRHGMIWLPSNPLLCKVNTTWSFLEMGKEVVAPVTGWSRLVLSANLVSDRVEKIFKNNRCLEEFN